MTKNYKFYVDSLGLQEHREGGYYKETYLSKEQIKLDDGRIRNLTSNILFLLTANNPSHFHRLKSDELWFYHAGRPLTIHMLFPDGDYHSVTLGDGVDELFQYTVPKGVIFGSTVCGEGDDFSIVGCVVTPAFHYDDFELFTQAELLKIYPKEKNIIEKLAYKNLKN